MDPHARGHGPKLAQRAPRLFRFKSLFLAVATLFATGFMAACPLLDTLRSVFNDEGIPPPEVQSEDGKPSDKVPGHAGLEVEVTPPLGISLLLDGQKVATSAPYKAYDLQEGPHTLTIRGMGHHTLTMPIVLKSGKVLAFPVALRPRTPADNSPLKRIVGPKTTRANTQARAAGKSPRNASNNKVAQELKSPRNTTAPILPAGVASVRLQSATTPKTAVRLDGLLQSHSQIELERVWGTLDAGEISLQYRLASQGILELAVSPKNDAVWSLDLEPIEPGHTFRFSQGTRRLVRTAPDGSKQTLLLRRID